MTMLATDKWTDGQTSAMLKSTFQYVGAGLTTGMLTRQHNSCTVTICGIPLPSLAWLVILTDKEIAAPDSQFWVFAVS